MTMKVEDSFTPSNDLRSQSVARTPEARVENRQAERKREPEGDVASLSALGAQISRALEKEPPALTAKISRLQEAITNGTYDVPARQVSAKIVAAALKAEF